MILSRCDLGSRASDSMFDTSSDNRHPYRWTAFNAHVLIDGDGFAPTPVQQLLNGQDLSRLGLALLHNLDESRNRGRGVLTSEVANIPLGFGATSRVAAFTSRE
jgi:hypothetical protein